MSDPANELPENIRELLQAVVAKHEAKGWSNFQITQPKSFTHQGEIVSIRATAPTGKRLYQRFGQND